MIVMIPRAGVSDCFVPTILDEYAAAASSRQRYFLHIPVDIYKYFVEVLEEIGDACWY